MTQEKLCMIQEIVGGHKFNNIDLLRQAFTRKSYSQEKGGENNEVLEFIGDKMLDFVVVKRLTSTNNPEFGWIIENKGENKHEYQCKFDVQQLTEIKSKLVCRKTLAESVSKLNIQGYLIMGKGDVKNNVQNDDKVKEDLFEAVLGAIAIDSYFDISVLEHAVDVMLDLDHRIENEVGIITGK